MSIEIHSKAFEGSSEYASSRVHTGYNFVDCEFRGCVLAPDSRDLSLRPRVNQMTFRNCQQVGCSAIAVIVEDTLVDGLKTSSLLQTWACVFRHVTLKGKIDRLMLSPFFHPGEPNSKFQQVVAQANAAYYVTADWALDIRDAEFKDFDCRGVPSRLVRRDPETQIMVTRERVLASGDHIAAGGQYWHGWLKLFLQDNFYADAVLVAPKRDRRFKELVAGLAELRRQGVAESD